MNTDDLVGTLVGLFKKKLDWNMQKEERELTAKERESEKRTDLEYRKYEGQLENDRDKMAWEKKEKLGMTIKGNHDVQKMANQGLLDVEKLKNINATEMAKIGHDYKIDEEKVKAVSDLFKAAKGTVVKNVDGSSTVTEDNSDAQKMATHMGRQMGMLPAEGPPSGGGEQGKIDPAMAAGEIQKRIAAGDPQGAAQFRKQLPPDVQSQVDSIVLPPPTPQAPLTGASATAQPGTIAPQAPLTGALAPTQAAPAPGRPPIQPAAQSPTTGAGYAGSAFYNIGIPARPEIQESAKQIWGPPKDNLLDGTVASVGDSVIKAGTDFSSAIEQEKKNRNRTLILANR